MKLLRDKREGVASATLTQTLLAMLVCSLFLVGAAYATDPTLWNDPSWWTNNGTGSMPAVMSPQVVTNDDSSISTNYVTNQNAVVVQGQLKQFTARAVDELNADLAIGAGTNLNNLVQGWAQDYATNNYSSSTNPFSPYKPSDLNAVNVGQLKYVGHMVWSQLVASGYTNSVPSWLDRASVIGPGGV